MPGTFTLVLETSTPQASLALAGPLDDVTQREFASDRSHHACLFGPLGELLELSAGACLKLVLVGSGPGSYSGTRVGIAAAQGVALARECPAVALPSILALPAAAGAAGCWVIGDARRGGYWVARVVASQMEQPPQLTDAAGLIAAIAPALDNGLPVVSFENPARFPLPQSLAAGVKQEFPSAVRLWRAWQLATAATRATWEAAAPQPLYLKPPHITPTKRSWLVPS
ncbi:MAG: tRNA (adenosine(37)-N6)-threonylcarbamoyltransferase complex dimerization subunit type 1 TsaB [Verrucomicrobiota bacterium]